MAAAPRGREIVAIAASAEPVYPAWSPLLIVGGFVLTGHSEVMRLFRGVCLRSSKKLN
jgi:hypothetical protein